MSNEKFTTPIKYIPEKENTDVLLSPRLIFPRITSPIPRNDEDQNDSFQLPLKIEEERHSLIIRKNKKFTVATLLFSTVIVIVFSFCYIDPFNLLQETSIQPLTQFNFVISIIGTVITLMFLLVAWRWMRTENTKTYTKLDKRPLVSV